MANARMPMMSRRALIGAGALGGAGLVLGLGASRSQIVNLFRGGPAAFTPNAYMRIAPDGRVTVIVGQTEMGQGIHTTLATAVAEELDADWAQVTVEAAGVDPHNFRNMLMGNEHLTAASVSTPAFLGLMRSAGAVGRAMLVQAAAERWKQDPAALRTENSVVLGPRGLRAGYGELVEAAARLDPPKAEGVKLKDPRAFKLLGRPIPKIENEAVVRGKLVYGIDFDHPELLTAVVARCPPVEGARLTSSDFAAARKSPGVRGVYRIPSGIAIVADHYWAALNGRAALAAEWDIGDKVRFSSAGLEEEYRALAAKPGAVAARQGDAEAALADHPRVFAADYTVPFLAHAAMEPLSCTIFEHGGGCDIWTGTQYQNKDVEVVAETLGLPQDKVRLHTMHLGSSFGRRATSNSDVALETAQIVKAARALKAPIKAMWSREDDIRGGFYRPMALSRVEAAVDAEGLPVAWRHRIVTQSTVEGTIFTKIFAPDGIDETSVAGARKLAYAVPHHLVELHSPGRGDGPSISWMRSVGNPMTALAVESFIDELAHRAGIDPMAYRRRLLAKDDPRLLNVLDIVADKSGWGKSMPGGRGMGVALQDYYGTKVAQVAEVTLAGDRLKVDRITTVVDCGRVLNPGIATAQIQGGVIFGLSSALYGEISVAGGLPQQSNFNDYPVARMENCPLIDVHLVDSSEESLGVGETGVPHVGPALCNAIVAAGGRRIRKLPLTASGFSI